MMVPPSYSEPRQRGECPTPRLDVTSKVSLFAAAHVPTVRFPQQLNHPLPDLTCPRYVQHLTARPDQVNLHRNRSQRVR